MLKFQAVLFDCDGVLVDSEPITNGLLRDMLEEQGWKLTHEECFAHFVGKAVMDERLAAGCTVFGYAPRDEHSALRSAGAHHTFTDMAHLPSLLGQKMAQSIFS